MNSGSKQASPKERTRNSIIWPSKNCETQTSLLLCAHRTISDEQQSKVGRNTNASGNHDARRNKKTEGFHVVCIRRANASYLVRMMMISLVFSASNLTRIFGCFD